ncbi:MAG: class II fructose-bisphosphate aldolase [Armatimonadota bacterium]|nr:class II fructose-bisphosphate aldolase [Armatimonadota bacterium]
MKRSDRLARLVRAAARNGIVIPAFNVFYMPLIKPICDALKAHDTLGMVEISRIEIQKFEVPSISAAAEEYRKYADPKVTALHLDHIPVIDEDGLEVNWHPLIEEGIQSGYDSVMIDASRLPFEENVEITAEVVRMAHTEGVLVEAELGSVLGHETGPLPPYEELFESKAGFTDPEQAREFVKRTNVDWLSVSVGSVHGAIAGAAKNEAKVEARLDIERIRQLRDATGVPLVLHGGSGIRLEYVREAIANGIAKINIATDIRQPYDRVLSSGGSIEEGQKVVFETISDIIVNRYGIQGSASRLERLITSQ